MTTIQMKDDSTGTADMITVNDLTMLITAITSSEPIDGLGDGDMSPDWQVTGPLRANLRAERSGQHDDGASPSERMDSGRVYTLHIACTDEGRNLSTATTVVTVPNDRKR